MTEKTELEGFFRQYDSLFSLIFFFVYLVHYTYLVFESFRAIDEVKSDIAVQLRAASQQRRVRLENEQQQRRRMQSARPTGASMVRLPTNSDSVLQIHGLVPSNVPTNSSRVPSSVPTNYIPLSTLDTETTTIGLKDFAQPDRERVIQTMLANANVLDLLSDRVFPRGRK